MLIGSHALYVQKKRWVQWVHGYNTPQTRASIGFSLYPLRENVVGIGGYKASAGGGKASVVPTVPTLYPPNI